MNKKQFAVVLILAVVSGLVGGGISSWLVGSQPVLAQDSPRKVITAEEFKVVDPMGKTRAKLGLKGDDVGLELLASEDQPFPRATFYLDTKGGGMELMSGVSDSGLTGIRMGFSEGPPYISLVDGSSGGAILVVGPSGVSLSSTVMSVQSLVRSC